MSVRPSSSTATGPPVVSTVGMSGNLPPAGLGPPWLLLRGEHGARDDADRGDDQCDDQAHDEDAVAAIFERRDEGEQEREGDRQPPPAAGRGVAKAEAGEEEEDEGDDHDERGSQDSNLGPPVLETGATSQLSYCPWPLILGGAARHVVLLVWEHMFAL